MDTKTPLSVNKSLESVNPPIDIALALIHQKATSSNRGDFNDPAKICSCCGLNYSASPYNLEDSCNQFINLGTSYVVFFKLLKFLIGLSFVIFLVSTASYLVYLPIFIDCLFKTCNQEDFVLRYKETLKITHWIALGLVLFMIIAKNVFSYHILKLNKYINAHVVGPGSFTAFVRQLPKGLSETQICQKLEQISRRNLSIVKINKIYKIDKILEIIDNYIEEEQKLIKFFKSHDLEKADVGYLYLKLNQINASIINYVDGISQHSSMIDIDTGEAFVTFSSIKDLNDFLKAVKLPRIYRKCTSGIYAVKALNPADMIWNNYGQSYNRKLLRRIVSPITAILIMFITLYIFSYINLFKTDILYKENKYTVIYTNIFISIVLSIINTLLQFLLTVTTEAEKRLTYTDYYISLIWKQSIALFINSVIVILLLDVKRSIWRIYTREGMAKIIWVVMIYNVPYNLVSGILDYNYLVKVLNRWVVFRNLKKNKKMHISQYEVNEVFENIDFDIGSKSYLMLRSAYIAFFMAAIIPLGLFLLSIELLISYWTWKAIFVYRSTYPRELDFKLSNNLTRFISNLFILYSFGFIIADAAFLGYVSSLSAIMLLLSCIERYIVKNKIIRLFDRKIFYTDEEVSYLKVMPDFLYDYDRLNPMTQKQAYRAWMDDETIDTGRYRPVNIKTVLSNLYYYALHNKSVKYRITRSEWLPSPLFISKDDNNDPNDTLDLYKIDNNIRKEYNGYRLNELGVSYFSPKNFKYSPLKDLTMQAGHKGYKQLVKDKYYSYANKRDAEINNNYDGFRIKLYRESEINANLDREKVRKEEERSFATLTSNN